jgi:hypothetical protein
MIFSRDKSITGTPLKEIQDIGVTRAMAEKLWATLDDVDTLSDVLKPHDEASYKRFYDSTMKIVAKRTEQLTSDGYELFLPNGEHA